jgi:ketosteroid isomerase-like protein
VLAALSECDLDAFAALIDPEVEIETERGTKRGAEEALRWAGHRYDHLERRYELDELRERGDTVVALARTQYVWRESGKLGEEWLHGIVLAFRAGRLVRWRVYDDPIEALEAIDE